MIAEKILITGSSGFIGLSLCKRMVSDGCYVRGTVRSAEQAASPSAGVEVIPIKSIGADTKTRLVRADRGQKVKRISLDQVAHIAINRNPRANLLKKALFAFSRRPSLSAIKDRLANAGKIQDIKDVLSKEFCINSAKIKANIHNVEHHRAHMGSSFP